MFIESVAPLVKIISFVEFALIKDLATSLDFSYKSVASILREFIPLWTFSYEFSRNSEIE